jgi:hypothetical protein
MNTLIQEAGETYFKIQTTLLELTQVYEGLVARKNEIYDAICLKVVKMERAQFEKHSDIIIQSQSHCG